MLQSLGEKLVGKFVVLDGPDGSGKGTQLQMLESGLTGLGLGVVRAKDPGGTAIGSRIRELVLGQDLTAMDIRCEALLFMASRAQLVAEVIRPALAEDRTVLCDRFISATFAYQGAAGLDMKQIRQLGDWAVGQTWPDVTVVLDVPAEVGLARVGRASRVQSRSPSAGQYTIFEDAVSDAMERRPLSFHRRVREIFRQLPALYPRPVVLVDGTGSVQEVHRVVLEALAGAGF
jgi:dTMP kinase